MQQRPRNGKRCKECNRHTELTSVNLTNALGVVDTNVLEFYCPDCDVTERERDDLDPLILNELMEWLRGEARDLQARQVTLYEDSRVLVLRDPQGHVLEELRDRYGDTADRVMTELARRHGDSEWAWATPPVTVIKRERGAEDVCECGECSLELGGAVDVTVTDGRVEAVSCRACGAVVGRDRETLERLVESVGEGVPAWARVESSGDGGGAGGVRARLRALWPF